MKITDIELSKSISPEIHDYYTTALEFIYSNPDYTLLKFREVIDLVVAAVADKHKVDINRETLLDKITKIFDCQLISYPVKENLHKIRQLCNAGIHKTPTLNGDDDSYINRKNQLLESSKEARCLVVAVLQDAHAILFNNTCNAQIELIEPGHQEYREILFDAASTCCAKKKLKAGMIYEALRNEQANKAPLLISASFKAHIANIEKDALNSFDAACIISSDIDKNILMPRSPTEEEQIICDNAHVEALYRYAGMALCYDLSDELLRTAKSRLKAAADRGYGPAIAMFGALLYEDGEWVKAMPYLLFAEKKEEPLALRSLFYLYGNGTAGSIDNEKALDCINRAVELGCPDALATLGEAYHKGFVVPQDNATAKELLENSIDRGSVLGKNYYAVEFNDLAGKMAKGIAAFADNWKKAVEESKPKPFRSKKKLKPNERCDCGSGKKYKKCCRIKPALEIAHDQVKAFLDSQ